MRIKLLHILKLRIFFKPFNSARFQIHKCTPFVPPYMETGGTKGHGDLQEVVTFW